jgi:DNA-binding transcriptional ArsR family regulator/rhodanese-related sulfurtransferase
MDKKITVKADVFDSFAEVVKALGNGRRLELVELLAQGEHSVDALTRMTGIALTTVSAHLQVLKQIGLVSTRRQGTTIFYRLAGDDVAELYVLAKAVGLRHSARLRETVREYMQEAETENVSRGVPVAMTGSMTVVDVRPLIEYEAGHLPGALSIPIGELADRYGEIPAGKPVIMYCRGEFCRLAREAAQWLRERGIEAMAMDEGVMEWRVSGEVEFDAA